MRYFRSLIIIATVIILTSCSILKTKYPEPAPYVHTDKFTGTWYEIIGTPTFYNGGCSCSKGEYTPDKSNSNKFQIINSCFKTKENKWFSCLRARNAMLAGAPGLVAGRPQGSLITSEPGGTPYRFAPAPFREQLVVVAGFMSLLVRCNRSGLERQLLGKRVIKAYGFLYCVSARARTRDSSW